MADLDTFLPQIQEGDADAFGRWLAGAESRVRLSLKSFSVAVDTEAVLQEALLRTWQVAPRFKPDGRSDSLLRLSIRIARNLAISETRRRRAVPGSDWSDEPEAGVVGPEEPDPGLRAAIVDCYERLPKKPKQALALRIESAGAEPDAALAERAGMTLNTFLQNFTRARSFVADCLQRLGIDLGTVTP